MGLLKNIFTWWEGATFGTAMKTYAKGKRIGEDSNGNVYYQSRKLEQGRYRRWVMYQGSNDASRVPPEWHGWLHGTHDMPPQALPEPQAWEIPGNVNPTGTPAAYRPAGAPESGGHRSSSTGDYEAWSPTA